MTQYKIQRKLFEDAVLHGADPAASAATNTTALQAALAAVGAAGGGTVILTKPGTYLLATQGTNPYSAGKKYCLNIAHDNVSLWLGKGVILKLADGQQTDAGGAVDIIVASDRTGVRIFGSGRITGNTAGQTGWTGSYSQTGVNGAIINVFGSAGGNHDIEIAELQLDDHWSCPVNINNTVTRGSRILLENLYGFDCGEGFQVQKSDGVKVLNVRMEDPGDVAVGDGIELAECTEFEVDGCTVKTNGAGTAFDLFGSKYGTLSNFVIEGWAGGGISLGTTGGGVTVDQVTVGPGVIRDVPTTCLYGAQGFVQFNDIVITGHSAGPAIQNDTAGSSLPPLIFSNVVVRGGTASACQILGHRDARFYNCDFSENTGLSTDGIAVVRNLANDAPEIIVVGGSLKDNGRYGITFDSQGDSTFAPTGRIVGVDASGNGTAGINDTADRDIEVLDCKPVEATDPNVVASFAVMNTLSTNISSLGAGHKNQRLRIRLPVGTGRIISDNSDGGGNLHLANSETIKLWGPETLTLEYDKDNSRWVEVARSMNDVGTRLLVVDGWYQENVAASQTNVNLGRGGGTITQRFYLPKAANLRAVGVFSNEARTAGTLTVGIWWDGAGPNSTVALDATNTTSNRTLIDRKTTAIGAGSWLEMRVTTDASWAPTTADIIAWVELEV